MNTTSQHETRVSQFGGLVAETSAATMSIVSIGRVTGRVGRLPDAIRAAATELDIRPAMLIDGREMYHEVDVDRIADHLDRKAMLLASQRQSGNLE